jgi:hypothetical protein
MVQALVAGALLGVGALAAERVAGWFGLPRRAAWTAAMAGSLLLPALSLLFPGLLPDLGILPDARGAIAADASALQWLGSGGGAATGAPAPAASSFLTDLPHLLGLGWLALSLGMLAALGWTYRRIRAARAGTVAAEVDGVRVRVAERLGPAVVGLRRPVVVLPRWVLEAPAEERRLILLHEREHLASRDGWLLFLGALMVAAMPWSLPLWWQHRRLRAAVETDCDARVLSGGASRRTYGQILIRTAGGRPLLPLLSPAWGETTSQLERRIMRMTEKRPTHRLLRSAPLVALAVGVVATACDVAGRSDESNAPELATGPVSHSSTPRGSAATDAGEGHMTQVVYTTMNDHGRVALGLGSVTWEEGTGPAFRDGKVLPPTGYPVVGHLATTGGLWKAGLRDGDVILAVNGADGRQPRLFSDAAPGSHYDIRVRRGAQEREFQVVLE